MNGLKYVLVSLLPTKHTPKYAVLSFCSESYAFEYDLGENKAEKGSTVTLSVSLIGGTTFKIIGMMLCNR